MRRQLLTGLRMTACLIVVCGLLYPLAVFGVSQVAFKHRADGSFIEDANGRVVGSSLLGQRFVGSDGRPDVRYFQPRPSAAGADGYDAQTSGGSNLGPSNPKLLDAVRQRVADYRQFNGVTTDVPVPVDAVTASASGLDPDISLANADLQAVRVAQARGLPIDVVRSMIAAHTEDRAWGFLGEKVVNVLELNLGLDRQG